MVKILSAKQIRDWDAYTIQNEPIESIDLMERASLAFVQWFQRECPDEDRPVIICCGPGNNGGDGLAVARLLHQRFYKVQVYCCKIGNIVSTDFAANLERLLSLKEQLLDNIVEGSPLPAIPENAYFVDALFGTGLNRPVKDYWAELIRHINQSGAEIISIDLPSGLFADKASTGTCIHATKCFSFELPRLAFFFAENQRFAGHWSYGSIGLLPGFLAKADTPYFLLSENDIRAILQPRQKFSHKGTYGHAVLMVGSKGMAGAAILAARACLKSGVGLLTVHVPADIGDLLQASVPEAMLSIDSHQQYISEVPALRKWDAVGIGPGLGKEANTGRLLRTYLTLTNSPLVLDADALNLIAAQPELLDKIPENSILTPHPKEFERLFGKSKNNFEQNELLRNFARQLGVYIVLKGAHTVIADPEGHCYFNNTGNPGMATAGSGDVLAGILTGLLAQGYSSKQTCFLGVWLHGLAGDLAAAKMSQQALTASDIVDHIGAGYLHLQN